MRGKSETSLYQNSWLLTPKTSACSCLCSTGLCVDIVLLHLWVGVLCVCACVGVAHGWAMSRAYKSRSKASTEHVVNWVHWTVCMCVTASLGRTDACPQMSAFFSSPWIKGNPFIPRVLVGGCYVCVQEWERQSKPVWSDKLEFNWLWWGYRGHTRRRTDKKQRWLPFLLGSLAVLIERSAKTGMVLVTLNHSNSFPDLKYGL